MENEQLVEMATKILTKRELFAIMMLPTIVSSKDAWSDAGFDGRKELSVIENKTFLACMYADTLLAQMEATKDLVPVINSQGEMEYVQK